jgi:hypothetical protein
MAIMKIVVITIGIYHLATKRATSGIAFIAIGLVL